MLKAKKKGRNQIEIDHNGSLAEKMAELVALTDWLMRKMGPEAKVNDELAADWLMNTLTEVHRKIKEDWKEEEEAQEAERHED